MNGKTVWIATEETLAGETMMLLVSLETWKNVVSSGKRCSSVFVL